MSASPEMLESYRRDKVVQDNIVESWVCIDCGVNTAPNVPNGPQTRINLRVYGKSRVTYDRGCEVYAVKDAIWKKAGVRPWQGALCIGCLEIRLGRQLRPRDFSRHDRETWANLPCTDRLLNRRGLTSGPGEIALDVTWEDIIE